MVIFMSSLPTLPIAKVVQSEQGIQASFPHWACHGKEVKAIWDAYGEMAAHMARLVQLEMIHAVRDFLTAAPHLVGQAHLSWEVKSAANFFDVNVRVLASSATAKDSVAIDSLCQAAESVPVDAIVLRALTHESDGAFTEGFSIQILDALEHRLLDPYVGPYQAGQRHGQLSTVLLSPSRSSRPRS